MFSDAKGSRMCKRNPTFLLSFLAQFFKMKPLKASDYEEQIVTIEGTRSLFSQIEVSDPLSINFFTALSCCFPPNSRTNFLFYKISVADCSG